MSWGPLTIARHTELKSSGVHLRVLVNGIDVTDDCQYADDTPGDEQAICVRRTKNGRAHLDEDGEISKIVYRTIGGEPRIEIKPIAHS